MYKFFISGLYVLCFSVNICSQITLTSSMNPVPGDIQYQVRADTNGITQGGSGANQVWRYPNLIKVDSSLVQTWRNAMLELKAGTYKADFVGSNFPSRVYFYVINEGSHNETKKMVLIKINNYITISLNNLLILRG